MHWFWRAAGAALLGTLALGLAGLLAATLLEGSEVKSYLLAFGLLALASHLLAVVVHREPVQEGETRCRKCRYILRGITEPRCPECGERI